MRPGEHPGCTRRESVNPALLSQAVDLGTCSPVVALDCCAGQ
jgi:hypothetical protein